MSLALVNPFHYIEISITPPYSFHKEMYDDGTNFDKGQTIRLADYQDIYKNTDVITQRWMLDYLPPWTFSRILYLMNLHGRPLPALRCTQFPSDGIGEYRPVGRIVINSDIEPTDRLFNTMPDSLLSVFVHELQHHAQFIDNRIRNTESINGQRCVLWEQQKYVFHDLTVDEYNNLPWEKEANITAYKVVQTLIKEGHLKHYFTPKETIYEYYKRTSEKIIQPCRATEESNSLSDVS